MDSQPGQAPALLSALDSSPAREIFQLSTEGMFIADRESGSLLRFNRRMVQFLGFDDAELAALKICGLTSAAKQPALHDFVRTTAAANEPRTLTCFLQRKDGVLFPCELKLQPVGEHWLLGTFRDISDRIRALEDIHLRNVAIANVSSGVTIADARHPDLPLIYVNSGFQQITGYSAKEAVGRSCRFLQGTDRQQPALDILRKALREGSACTVLLRNYRKDGTLFFNELHISPVRNEFRELTHFVGIQIDVTDRERSREVLERSESRYRLLANAVDDLIIRRHPSGTIEFASKASQTLLNRSPESIQNRNILELVHFEDRELLHSHSLKLINERSSRTLTFRMAHADGSFRWLESRDNVLEPSAATESPLIVSVLRDITLRKKAEQEIQQALAREKEINELKTRFISMVSHEFRTPMTSIQSSAALLRDYGDHLSPEKQARHFQNMESSLKRMNRLLDEVLFFARVEADKQPINRKPLNLHAYCESLIENLRPIYPNRTIEFTTELPRSLRFNLDPHLLDHILQNLIGNALKYSQAPSPATLSVRLDGDFLDFQVRDKGIGIPLKDQKKLFDAFHRASNVGTTQGTGLGLNIALRAAELLGGSVEFSSTESVGSTFTAHLPAHILTHNP